MPTKYSHAKKRFPAKKNGNKDSRHIKLPHPNADRPISQAASAVSQVEKAISRILLLRYEQDMSRLFSTRLYSVALVHVPTFVMRCIHVGGPGWMAHNADSDLVKDFLRTVISMDLRQAGERVATKSVLWSYTALRHFAISNNVPICKNKGLHSLRLVPHFAALKEHLDALETMPPPSFSKPPHLGSLEDGQNALEEACQLKYTGALNDNLGLQPNWDHDWRIKVRTGYEKLVQTLWRIAREFDVRGYGSILRDKLTTKWCDCGCSTDHLSEVCEPTVRSQEEDSGIRLGKQKEWDGRGIGVYGWETEEEEDIWDVDLDLVGLDADELQDGVEPDMTISELTEWRYFKAELEKGAGNEAFRSGNYQAAVQHYEAAHSIEPELAHYQLNLAQAHLKLNNWMEAETACTKALAQHRSGKGYYRRAKARKMLGRSEEAIRDLRAILKLQPNNAEALTELVAFFPLSPDATDNSCGSSSSSQQAALHLAELYSRVGVQRPKAQKPLPFARTAADDRKLKISFVDSSSHRHHSSSCQMGCCGPLRKSPKTSSKGIELEQLRQARTVYPSWQNYHVTVSK